jgi:hypothetical protein
LWRAGDLDAPVDQTGCWRGDPPRRIVTDRRGLGAEAERLGAGDQPGAPPAAPFQQVDARTGEPAVELDEELTRFRGEQLVLARLPRRTSTAPDLDGCHVTPRLW